MGWTYTYVGRNKKRKDIILDEIINWNNYDIVRAEEKGSNVWVIAENKENKHRFGILYLTHYENGDFGYKDISIDMHPYYYNCSKTFYELCKEIYGNSDNEYAKEWLKDYEKYNLAEKERKDKIKNLKVGDRVKFGENVNYGNQRIWTVSHILNNGKVLFENYNLRGWKKQDFEILDKDYVVTLKEKYIREAI